MSATPKYGHAPIRMRRVDGELAALGEFRWRHDPGGPVLEVAIPAPCPRGWVASEWTIDHLNYCDASWSWDRDVERPTLRPSLHAVARLRRRRRAAGGVT